MSVLVGVFLFDWLFLDPRARYCASAPVFFFRGDFFQEHLRSPGGPLAYLAALLAQLDYQPVLGALVLAGLVGKLWLATWLWQRHAGWGSGWVAWVPAGLLVVLAAQYDPPLLEVGGGVLLVVLGLCVGQFWGNRSAAGRLVVFLVFAIALFLVAGPFPGLLFIVTAVVHEAVVRRSLLGAVGCAAALLPWWLAVFVGETNDLPAIVRGWGDAKGVAVIVLLYAFFPVAVIGRFLGAKVPWFRGADGQRRPVESVAGGWWTWAVRVGLGVAVAAAFVGTFDGEHRAWRRIQSAAEWQDWMAVLAAGSSLRMLPTPTRLQVNRALFHSGRLVDDLFAFPQRREADLLASLADGPDVCLPLCDTLLELGQVNLAEHYVQEAEETRGEHPAMLWRLAKINLVKERPRAARVFLNRLRAVPFHRAEAERWLASLDQDPSGDSLDDLRRLHAVRVRADTVERVFPTEPLLEQLLKTNPQNRMAAEYLEAYFLLTGQVEQAVENRRLVERGERRELPRTVVEAMLIFNRRPGNQPVALPGLPGDQAVARRFDRFLEVLRQAADKPTAERTQAADFGDTYWYYDVFGRNPGRVGVTASGERR
jgi:hypothetical protein